MTPLFDSGDSPDIMMLPEGFQAQVEAQNPCIVPCFECALVSLMCWCQLAPPHLSPTFADLFVKMLPCSLVCMLVWWYHAFPCHPVCFICSLICCMWQAIVSAFKAVVSQHQPRMLQLLSQVGLQVLPMGTTHPLSMSVS